MRPYGEPILVQGAAMASTTMMPGLDVNITHTVPDVAPIEVDVAATSSVPEVSGL